VGDVIDSRCACGARRFNGGKGKRRGPWLYFDAEGSFLSAEPACTRVKRTRKLMQQLGLPGIELKKVGR
jgi:hypothetical protein